MADISWDLHDPIVEMVEFEQGKTGQWNVKVSLRERWLNSLGSRVVEARLVREGRIFDKDLDSATWTPATTRVARSNKPSRTTMTFHVGAEDYPSKGKVEVVISEP